MFIIDQAICWAHKTQQSHNEIGSDKTQVRNKDFNSNVGLNVIITVFVSQNVNVLKTISSDL